MKRPLCVIGTAYALATRFAFLFDARTAGVLAAAFLAAGAVSMAVRRAPRVLCVSLFTVAAACVACVFYQARSVLPLERVEGETVVVEGLITSAEALGKSNSYTVRARFPENPGLPGGKTIAVRQYGDAEFFTGDTVRCAVKLSTPSSTNYESYYRAQGIAAMGTVVDGIRPAELAGFRAQRLFLGLRELLRQNVYRHLEGDVADVVSAMVLGMQDQVSSELYTQINRSGVSHLLAVSGLHLSVVTASVLAVLERLRVNRRLAGALALLAAALFLLLVGPRASLVRAFVMTAVMLLARILSQKDDPLTSLGLAVLVCCVFWPYWTLSKGLWLSAGSTLGILLLGQRWSNALTKRLKTGNKLLRYPLSFVLANLAVSGAAYLFTLPLLLVYNGWISLVSPLSNLLVAPFVTPVIVCGILCAAVGDALFMRPVATVCRWCTRAILGVASFTSELPLATTSLDQAYKLIWLAGAAAGAALLLRYKADRRLLGFGAALCALTFCAGGFSHAWAARNTVELVTISRCDAVLLLRGDEAVLLGAPTRYNIGQLSKYLHFRNVRRVSAVVAPDYGEQIDSGILRLAGEYGVDCVVGPDDAYILGQLELALGQPVYSGGYAVVEVLGGVEITISQSGDEITVTAGGEQAHKHLGGPAAWKDDGDIHIYEDAALRLPPNRAALWEPVGGRLYGEQRLELHLD